MIRVRLYSQKLDDLLDDPLELQLPATEEQLYQARKDLGVSHFGECQICGVSSPLPILERLDYYDQVRLMNGMAKAARKAQDSGQLDVFTAYLETHEDLPVQALLQNVEHLDCYELYPGALEEYGRQEFLRNNPGTYTKQIRLDQYGEDCLNETGGWITPNGGVLLPKISDMKLYAPLAIKTEVDHSSMLQEYQGNGAAHIDTIKSYLKRSIARHDSNLGLAKWFPQSDPDNRVLSICPDVEEHQGELWGTLFIRKQGWLDDRQYDWLLRYCTSQLSDGWGEGFEQQPISTEDGPLYISFWNNHDGWRLFPENEFRQMLEQTHWPDNPGPAQG